jgi:hypothetical protein
MIETNAVTTRMDVARDVLYKIAEKSGGVISPRSVIEVAKSEDHPLHDYFLWDDTAAANRYRLNQAALLIRRIKIDIIKPAREPKNIKIETTREFPSLSKLRGKENAGSYVALEKVMTNDGMKSDLIETAKQELIAIKKKYQTLVEFTKVWQAIDSL